MESFVADLKKQVQCSLCNDTLTEPKILPCFDTFCKPCIKRHAELIEEVNVFKCPKCKSQTSLPEPNSVEDLQPSLLHSRILKGLALVEGEKACSVSDSHSSASWHCFDCDRSMCDECEKSHSLFIKDHKVVRLADFEKEDIEIIIARENPCKNHSHHRLELFCEDCDDMICVTCWKHDHKDHKTMSLDKFASIKKAVLSQHLQVLEQLRSDDNEKQQQENIANTIKQQGEQAKKEVKDITKKIIEILQENELELLRQIDENMDKATKNLNIIHHIPAVEEYIENMMERGLASEMMNIQETDCSQSFMFNHISLSSRVEFVPNEQLVREVNSGLGEIQNWPKTDYTQSFIEVNSETEALKKEKLTVITKTSIGELNYDPRDVVDVQLKPERNVKIEKRCLRADGQLEVHFVGKVAGQLTAEVQVNGNHVSNSPLVVNVKPQILRTGQFKTKGVNVESSWLTGVAVNRDKSRIAVASPNSVYVIGASHRKLLFTYNTLLRSAQGLAFLNDTDLVIAEYDSHRICIVNTATKKLIKTFGKEGYGDGEFSNPNGVHVDADSNIIVCDTGNRRVQVFTKDGDYQYKFPLKTPFQFNPHDVATHDGLFYVSDCNNRIIHVFEKKSGDVPTRISTISPYSYKMADYQLSRPCGLTIDNDHHLLVCDEGTNRVLKFTLDGRLVGRTGDVIKNPKYITVLKDGQLLVSTVDSVVSCKVELATINVYI